MLTSCNRKFSLADRDLHGRERTTGEPLLFQISSISYRGILLAPSSRIWTYKSKGFRNNNLTSM